MSMTSTGCRPSEVTDQTFNRWSTSGVCLPMSSAISAMVAMVRLNVVRIFVNNRLVSKEKIAVYACVVFRSIVLVVVSGGIIMVMMVTVPSFLFFFQSVRRFFGRGFSLLHMLSCIGRPCFQPTHRMRQSGHIELAGCHCSMILIPMKLMRVFLIEFRLAFITQRIRIPRKQVSAVS